MAFGAFQDVQDVARMFQVALNVESFIRPVPMAVDERFAAEMHLTLEHMAFRASEASKAEFLIAPVLREMWKAYRDSLLLWSHVPLGTEEPLRGTPDYLFCKRSPLGFVQDQPYLIVVEAKRDDFEAGWGQCLAAMLAAQRLNAHADQPIFGCVSNGDLWQFGRLEGKTFTQEVKGFVISDLDGLFAALNCIFQQARELALSA